MIIAELQKAKQPSSQLLHKSMYHVSWLLKKLIKLQIIAHIHQNICTYTSIYIYKFYKLKKKLILKDYIQTNI